MEEENGVWLHSHAGTFYLLMRERLLFLYADFRKFNAMEKLFFVKIIKKDVDQHLI